MGSYFAVILNHFQNWLCNFFDNLITEFTVNPQIIGIYVFAIGKNNITRKV